MVADSIFKPNEGKNQEIVQTKNLLNISAVVQEKYDGKSPDLKIFPIVFKNIFQK